MKEEMLRKEAMRFAGNLQAEEMIIQDMEMSQAPERTYTTQILTIYCC